MKIAVVIILALGLLTNSTIAQEDSNFNHHVRLGMLIMSGNSLYKLPENSYYIPVLLSGYIHLPFYKSKNNFNVAANFIPHFGFARFSSDTEFEFGLNLWIELAYQIKKVNIISAQIGSGPHYITVETDRQANGFIFSDNIMGSYSRMIESNNNSFAIGMYMIYRHISNAGIQEPNKGIDNILFGVSFSKLY